MSKEHYSQSISFSLHCSTQDRFRLFLFDFFVQETIKGQDMNVPIISGGSWDMLRLQ